MSCNCDDIIIEIPTGTITIEMPPDGKDGTDGVGIADIVLLSEVGLVKTYRINYTDGSHFDYTVSDGAQGEPGTTDYNDLINKPDLGTMASVNDAPSDGKEYARKNGEWSEVEGGITSVDWDDINNKPDFGDLATQDTVNYATEVTNKPTLGNLASKNTADYETDITNKPTLGALSALDSIDYTSNYLTNKPTLGNLASQDTVNYETEVTNTPTLGTMSAEDANDYYDKSEVDTALNGKAPVIVNSASGSVASISDAIAGNAVGLTVNVEPVQDLHGYDAPWPAGGGKNLVDFAHPTTSSKITSITDDGNGAFTVVVSGGSAYMNYTIPVTTGETYCVKCESVSNKSGTLSRLSTIYVYDGDITGSVLIDGQTATTTRTFTPSQSTVVLSWRSSLSTETSGTGIITKPQLEKGSTATSYAPYSNVCPISGWTEATVTRTGRNLLGFTIADLKTWNTSYDGYVWNGNEVSQNGVTWSFSTDEDGYVTECNANGTASSTARLTIKFDRLSGQNYMYSGNMSASGSSSTFLTLIQYLENGASLQGVSDYGDGKELPSTANPTADSFAIKPSIVSGYQAVNVKYRPMLEYGSSATSYVPYSGTQVTIDLDGTRYGGTVDVTNGTMTVDRAIVDLGTLSWTEIATGTTGKYRMRAILSDIKPVPDSSTIANAKCSIYNIGSWNQTYNCVDMTLGVSESDNKIAVYDSRYDTASSASAFTTAMSGVQLVYEIATPQTVTLTPTQLALLEGENNVWSDTGNVSLSYRADTKGYIDTAPHNTYYVKGTQTASTGSWTGDMPEVDALYEGLAIDYYLPYGGSGNATLELTLKGGVKTGAIPCYTNSTTRLSTQIPGNYIFRLIYQTVTISGTSYTGWWIIRSIDNNNEAYNIRFQSNYVTASSVIYRYQLLFHTDENTLTPLNNVSNQTGTSKAMLTNVEFDPYGRIYYYNSTTQRNANAVFNLDNGFYQYAGADLRYSLNCGTTLTANKLTYLKVIMQSNGKCKLASDPCWTQTLPSTADGYHYILLGRAYSTYQITLYPTHPVYYHDGVALREAYKWMPPSDGHTYGMKNGTWIALD